MERVTGNPIVKEASRDVDGNKTSEKKLEGRYFNTYQHWKVEKIKDTETRVPWEDYENTTWKERKKQNLKNQYREITELTFKDPKTSATMKAKSEALQAAVDEVAYTDWAAKKDRKFKKRGEDFFTSSKITQTKMKVAKAGSQPAIGGSSEGGNAAISGGSIGQSGETGSGGSSARFVSANKTKEILKYQNTRSKGANKVDFDPLFNAARGGLNLVDDGGSKWAVGFDGKALIFTPANGDPVRLEKGKDFAIGNKGAKVRVENFSVAGGRVTLTGEFDAGGKGKSVARVLRTR
jgi:hypothetical protein